MPSDTLLDFCERELAPCLSGQVYWLGVGNTQRGDDGAGPALIARLAGQGWKAADAGVAPENHLEKVVSSRPETLLLVDAADWGGQPGQVRLLSCRQLESGGLSTHALSLDLAAAYWAERLPGLKIHLLAVQPASLEWGAALSPAVAETVEGLAQYLQRFKI